MTSRHLAVPNRTVMTQGIIDAMKRHLPTWEADESDPGVYWADETTDMIIDLVNKVNEAADATFILTATKPAIFDHLTSVGITITDAIREQDLDSLREQYFNVWRGLSKDVPDYFIQLIRQIKSDVGSVSSNNRLAENTIDIYVADTSGDNYNATDRTAIQAYLNLSSNRPIWITYQVLPLVVTPYTLDATVSYARGSRNPRLLVEANANKAVEELRVAGGGIYLSALSDLLWAEGVTNIVFTNPTADLVSAYNKIYRGTVGTLTYSEVA